MIDDRLIQAILRDSLMLYRENSRLKEENLELQACVDRQIEIIRELEKNVIRKKDEEIARRIMSRFLNIGIKSGYD